MKGILRNGGFIRGIACNGSGGPVEGMETLIFYNTNLLMGDICIIRNISNYFRRLYADKRSQIYRCAHAPSS